MKKFFILRVTRTKLLKFMKKSFILRIFQINRIYLTLYTKYMLITILLYYNECM